MSTQYATPTEADIKVGDYFYTSWGYDQTNVNYFQVVGLTAKCVKIQEVETALAPDGGNVHDKATPGSNPKMGSWVRKPEGWSEYDANAPAPVMTKRIKVWGEGARRTVALAWKSYADLYLWDGQPKYQTGAYYGH